MDSIFLHNEEETTRIWLDEEQLINIVKAKISWTLMENVGFSEGSVSYVCPLNEIFLIN